MPRTSCIRFTEGSHVCIMREDYLRICDGSHAAAAVLSQMQYWHEVKLAHSFQAETDNTIAEREGLPATQDKTLWFYKAMAELQAELMGQFGETAVSGAVALLLRKGFIESRSNPRYRWDRTRQYRFIPGSIQAAIDASHTKHNNASDSPLECLKTTASMSQGCDYNPADLRLYKRNNTAAIPETTTETTSEKEDKDILSGGPTLAAACASAKHDVRGKSSAEELPQAVAEPQANAAEPQAKAAEAKPQYAPYVYEIWRMFPQDGRTRSSLKETAVACKKQKVQDCLADVMEGIQYFLSQKQFLDYTPGVHTWITQRKWEGREAGCSAKTTPVVITRKPYDVEAGFAKTMALAEAGRRANEERQQKLEAKRLEDLAKKEQFFR